MAANEGLDRLLGVLNTSGLQLSNPSLYQVISQLLANVKNLNQALLATINGGGSSSGLANQNYLTFLDNSTELPNSKELVNGPNIQFDDSTANEREIDITDTTVIPGTYGDASHVGQFTVDTKGRVTFADNIPITGGGSGIDYVVASDGVSSGPQPINDGAGNFVYIPYIP